jgi:ABC-type sugar transport system permease subunit
MRGTNFAMALLLIPWALPPVVSSLMWKWIFNPRLGTFNNILIALGLLDNFRTWQLEKWPAFFIIVIATVYMVIPISAFILTASLKTIPKELYEAAEIDGASPIYRFSKITLPLVRPSMLVLSILLSVVTFKAFDMIYIITKGGPCNFTSVLNFLSYQISFKFMKFGFGAAIAFFVSFLIIIISIIYYRTTYREIRYD